MPDTFNHPTAGARWYWLDAVAGGVLFGLGFHTYTVFRIAPLLVAALLPLMSHRFGWRRVIKVTGIFAAPAILVVLPLAFYFLRHQADFAGRANQISIFTDPHPFQRMADNLGRTAGMYTFAGDVNWRHNQAGRPMLCWPVGLLFLVGTGLAVWRHRWLLLFWLVAALPCILTVEGIPHALRAILTLPAVLLAAALGGIWLWRWLRSRYPQPAWQIIPCAFAALLAVIAYRSYFVQWSTNPVVAGWYNEEATLAARKLLALPRDQPKYVVFAPEKFATVRGFPSSARPIMFLTDTFTPARQQALHLHYLLPAAVSQIGSNQVYNVVIPSSEVESGQVYKVVIPPARP